MPIPPPAGVPMGLTEATPSKLDADTLTAQLENIGLSCAQINTQNLQSYITEVESQLPAGNVESFSITAPGGTIAAESLPPNVDFVDNVSTLMAEAPVDALESSVAPAQTAAVGNWTENDAAEGWSANLFVIQVADHFNWLMTQASSNGFQGVVDNPAAYTGNYPNAEAIQKLFVNVGLTASSTVVQGIDKDTMSAVFSNAIQPLADADLSTYNQGGSRAIMLVENYNQSTGYADAIGVVSVDWTLKITDWKRKTKDGGDTHPTVLNVSARSALYSDVKLLCNHYFAVLTQFGINPTTAPTCRTI